MRHIPDADWGEIDVAPEFVCLSFIAWGARRLQFDHDLAALERENNQQIRVPPAFFRILLCLAGLGGAWRVAARVWQLPSVIGEALMLVAAIVWVLMLALYAAKWIYAPEEALQ